VTVTAVGYGDIAPQSVQGRIAAMIVMLVGIGFLSVLTASIASMFVKTERGAETKEIMATLTRVEAELAELRRQLARP
jgi:voltage-gated potassium channel